MLYVILTPYPALSLPFHSSLLIAGCLFLAFAMLRMTRKRLARGKHWASRSIMRTDTSIPEREPDETGGNVKWVIDEHKPGDRGGGGDA